jgi:hypothetical protein
MTPVASEGGEQPEPKSVSENCEAHRMRKAENTDEVSYGGRLIGIFSRKRSSGVVALPSKTAAGILSHRAEPLNLFGENGNPRNFQTGSN